LPRSPIRPTRGPDSGPFPSPGRHGSCPGAASFGRVAPFIVRTIEIASGPSNAMATSGPEVMKATRPSKKRLALVHGVVPLGQIAIHPDKLEPDNLEAALFETGDDTAD